MFDVFGSLIVCLIVNGIYSFCAALRSTFRQSGDGSSGMLTKSAMNRHAALYHIGRALYESADYFGQLMRPKDKVYHGLSQKMQFSSFTEYFNAPTSTTTKRSVGMHRICICGPKLSLSDFSLF